MLAAGTSGQALISNGTSAPSWGSAISRGTVVNTTSGTNIDFTSIPAFVKRITVMLNGVSTNGTSLVQIQLGTSGIPTTSGYYSGATRIGGTNTNGNSTTGFLTDFLSGAAETRTGIMTITNISGNIWVYSSSVSSQGGSDVGSIANGSISLSGTLDMLRLTTVIGTQTFDAGSINILYE